MRLLVTGASGFIGRNLLRHVDRDWEVVAVYHSSVAFPEFVRSTMAGRNVHAVRCNLTDATAVKDMLDREGNRFDLAYLLAAKVDIPRSLAHPLDDLWANAATVINIVPHLSCGHLVYLSTGAVYEGQVGKANRHLPLTPSLPYAAHKLLAESYARAALERYGTAERVTIVRFFGAYGPYEPPNKIYGRLVRRFGIERIPEYTIYGGGGNLIDAMWIDDACEGLLRIGLGPAKPDKAVAVWDFAAGNPLTIEELVRLAGQVLLGEEVRILKQGVAHENHFFCGDPAPLEKALGIWARTPLEEGLRAFHAFLQREKDTS